MVYIALKTVLSTAAIALLALTHVQAAPAGGITLKEIAEIGEKFLDEMYEPTLEVNRCKAQCYTESLREVLEDTATVKWFKEVDVVDKCVKNLLGGMKTMQDITDKYENKKWVIHWNMGQFCADVLERKGKVPIMQWHKVPLIQAEALKCSQHKCDKPYDAAFLAAIKKSGTEVEEAMED
ncbi:hypothetical protein BGZ67_008547 [Mortierella alpina]|nr:hypothetical protein BGZ67_008547 [Mortierella alpina]